MDSLSEGLTLFWCIIDFGKGSKLFKLYQDSKGVGATIFLGRGTVNDELLNLLGILDTRKEIFLAVFDEKGIEDFYDRAVKRLNLDKPGRGIAFSMLVKYCSRIDGSRSVTNHKRKGVKDVGYEAIFVVVDKGLMDEVIEAAESAGSTGGTVIHGRGSGTKEKETLFNITIEPEKEIVLILSRANKTESIVNAVKERLNLDKPGAGIVFVMDVNRAVGLYENQ